LRRMSGVWPMVSEKDWRMGMGGKFRVVASWRARCPAFGGRRYCRGCDYGRRM